METSIWICLICRHLKLTLFSLADEVHESIAFYAETRFHGLNDDYRRYIATIDSENSRKATSMISFPIWRSCKQAQFPFAGTIQVPHEVGGKEYRDHLFVSDITSVATVKLNTWEARLLKRKKNERDFVCWIRNPSRGSWALCIPYEIDGENKACLS